MDPTTLRHRIRDLVEPTVQRSGFDLVAIEWTGGSGRGVLRLSIDRPPGFEPDPEDPERTPGVTADDCARISRAIEPLLDADDPVDGAYSLEVSSPGIERPVQRLSDFARFQGYRVRLRLEPGPPRRRYTGELRGTRGDDVVVLADGEEHAFHVDTIERAHLDLTLDEFEALGRGLPQPGDQEDSDDHQ
jgi:ribosome maturation factor RimP